MTGRLHAVPEHPRRMLGIVRVSKEKEAGVSPEIQVAAIRDHCSARGHVLVDIIEGLDQSGSQARSAWWPTLDRAVAAVEAGEYDGIVVWKFSRVARHRMRWAVALDRVETTGGILESATEQFDTQTSAGRFARGMTAEMNAFYAEMVGEGWKESHARRIASGRPHTGKPRFGYTYDPTDKLHKPHPEQGPMLADLYRRYVAGESIYQLVKWLNAHGWRTTSGGIWSDVRLRRVLNSGFAAGKFLAGGDPKRKIAPTLHDGIHEPLISPELWQSYLDARTARGRIPPRREASNYLLSGLLRCARCGKVMQAYREEGGRKYDNRRKKAYASAPVRLSFRCTRCPTLGRIGGYIASWRAEEAILAHVRQLAARVDEQAQQEVLINARQTLLDVEVDRLAREALRLEEALVRLATSNAENPLPPAVYASSKAELEERSAKIAAAIETAGATSRRATKQPEREAARLLEEWDELPAAGRREILRGLIDCVLVRTGKEPWFRLVEWSEARA